MAVLTSTAILMAAGAGLAGTVYSTETQKHESKKAQKKASRLTRAADQQAKNLAETQKAASIEKRRQRLVGFQRNQTAFGSVEGNAKAARTTLTG